MKIYGTKNVFDAALERIERIFGEFPNVIVSFSGGKDSTVILNLALIVAKKLNRLPLRVIFLDQEAEWSYVIDFVRATMADPRVQPMWFQVPIDIENSTSTTMPFLHCWGPGETWMREKEPSAYKDDVYGERTFYKLFAAILAKHFPDTPTAMLGGVTARESPARFMATTSQAIYKDITYGNGLKTGRKDHYTFYPIYDWLVTDVWKAIHDNAWPYCKLYDLYYQYGIAVNHMRVSNLHHETAVENLRFVQEIDRKTWGALTKRLSGINTAGQLAEACFATPKEYPRMFSGWAEYRDYLLRHLVTDDTYRKKLARRFATMDQKYEGIQCGEMVYRAQIKTILRNDVAMITLNNWEKSPEVNSWRKWKAGVRHSAQAKNKYIHGRQKHVRTGTNT